MESGGIMNTKDEVNKVIVDDVEYLLDEISDERELS